MSAARQRQAENFDENSFVVDMEQKFDFLSDEYRTLFAQSCATAFQSPEWLHVFYKRLAPALSAEPVIVTLRDGQTGELKATMPFVRQKSMGAKIVQPADMGVSDYNQLIASRQTLDDAAENPSIATQIVAQLKPFDAMIVRKQRDDGFCIS